MVRPAVPSLPLVPATPEGGVLGTSGYFTPRPPRRAALDEVARAYTGRKPKAERRHDALFPSLAESRPAAAVQPPMLQETSPTTTTTMVPPASTVVALDLLRGITTITRRVAEASAADVSSLLEDVRQRLACGAVAVIGAADEATPVVVAEACGRGVGQHLREESRPLGSGVHRGGISGIERALNIPVSDAFSAPTGLPQYAIVCTVAGRVFAPLEVESAATIAQLLRPLVERAFSPPQRDPTMTAARGAAYTHLLAALRVLREADLTTSDWSVVVSRAAQVCAPDASVVLSPQLGSRPKSLGDASHPSGTGVRHQPDSNLVVAHLAPPARSSAAAEVRFAFERTPSNEEVEAIRGFADAAALMLPMPCKSTVWDDGTLLTPLRFEKAVVRLERSPPDLFAGCLELNYDVLNLPAQLPPAAAADVATNVAVEVLMASGLPHQFGCPRGKLVNYVLACRSLYHERPYHNFFHAVDVTQTLYTYLFHANLATSLEPIETFALLLAGIAHDLNHPGVNNIFHAKAHTPLGVLSSCLGSSSSLEMHHASLAGAILAAPGFDVLSNATLVERHRALHLFNRGILDTDAAMHGELMAKAKTLRKWNGGDSHREALFSVMLHAADVSNPTKPFTVCQKWAHRAVAEFTLQGDAERDMGFSDIAPMFDRKLNQDVPRGQIGFINFMVEPYFELLSEIFPAMQFALAQTIHNKKQWQRMSVPSAGTTPTKAPQPPLPSSSPG